MTDAVIKWRGIRPDRPIQTPFLTARTSIGADAVLAIAYNLRRTLTITATVCAAGLIT
jgi:hypothetical protein